MKLEFLYKVFIEYDNKSVNIEKVKIVKETPKTFKLEEKGYYRDYIAVAKKCDVLYDDKLIPRGRYFYTTSEEIANSIYRKYIDYKIKRSETEIKNMKKRRDILVDIQKGFLDDK